MLLITGLQLGCRVLQLRCEATPALFCSLTHQYGILQGCHLILHLRIHASDDSTAMHQLDVF